MTILKFLRKLLQIFYVIIIYINKYIYIVCGYYTNEPLYYYAVSEIRTIDNPRAPTQSECRHRCFSNKAQ